MITSRSLVGVRETDLRDQQAIRISRLQPTTWISRPILQLADDLPVGRATLQR